MALMALRTLLQAQGDFRVVAESSSGAEVLGLVREHQPELVIVDLDIPVLGGIEVIKRLRSQFPGLGILVVSGRDSPSSPVQVLETGGNGFVHKSKAAEEIILAAKLVVHGQIFFTRDVIQQAQAGANPSEHRLSGRELEVLTRLASGHSNLEIAKALLLSNKTISTYKTRIMEKLGVSNIRELIEVAQRLGVIR